MAGPRKEPAPVSTRFGQFRESRPAEDTTGDESLRGSWVLLNHFPELLGLPAPSPPTITFPSHIVTLGDLRHLPRTQKRQGERAGRRRTSPRTGKWQMTKQFFIGRKRGVGGIFLSFVKDSRGGDRGRSQGGRSGRRSRTESEGRDQGAGPEGGASKELPSCRGRSL